MNNDSLKSRRVGFLFNHEAAHQVAHAAPILKEILLHYPDVEIVALVSTPAIRAHLITVLGRELATRVHMVNLKAKAPLSVIAKMLDPLMPATRYLTLKQNRALFESLDAIISPERTCLMLKTRFGHAHLKFIYTCHGAGDRSVSFHPSLGGFDLLLSCGAKYVDRYRENGILHTNQSAIVGYPKFDNVNLRQPRKPLFDNGKPTILYNPHFDPYLSSWYAQGEQVLEFFANNADYNLVVAPHVMLHRRRLHTSLEYRRFQIRRDIPERFYRCPNIKIDVDSPALFDMTYTLNADAYLGDVSSQVYEFLLRPRPCFFLNSHQANWRDDPYYLFWRAGPVVDNVCDLAPLLPNLTDIGAQYHAVQEQLFSETFDWQETPSSVRAAHAIMRFLMGQPVDHNLDLSEDSALSSAEFARAPRKLGASAR